MNCGLCKWFRQNPCNSATLIEGSCTYPLPASLITTDLYTVAASSMMNCRVYEGKRANGAVSETITK